MDVVENVLTFWFGGTDLTRDIELRDVWFRSTPEFDADIHARFGDTTKAAAAGELDHMRADREGCMALTILLDQFPRNLYRDTAMAFAADPKARAVARHVLDNDFHEDFSFWPRVFAFLPLEHSEDLADQELSVELLGSLGDETAAKAAIDHHAVIERFGRFPHRNAALGRENTPEEAQYLKTPPTWGKTAAELEEMENTQNDA